MTSAPSRRARPLTALLALGVSLSIALAGATAATADPGATSPPATSPPATAGTSAAGLAWSVEQVGAGDGDTGDDVRFRVTLELDRPLPVRAAAPTLTADGVVVGQAVESEDGLTLTVTTDDADVLSAETVDVAWVGNEVDPSTEAPPGTASAPVPSPDPSALPAAVPIPLDPSVDGPFGATAFDYDLGLQAAELRDTDGARGELSARVHHPTSAPGARPVVVLLHGRGPTCIATFDTQTTQTFAHPCPARQTPIDSAAGFDDLARTLATHGYVAVAVRANGVTAVDNTVRVQDGGAAARGDLVLQHLDLLARADGGDPAVPGLAALAGALDLDRVALVGHSRGGEGVLRALEIARAEARDVEIRSLLLLAPTDTRRLTDLGVPTQVVLPYCDGDVTRLDGQHVFEDSRLLGQAAGTLRGTTLVLGANHVSFNETWAPPASSSTGPLGEASKWPRDDWDWAPHPTNPDAVVDRRDDPACGSASPTAQRLKPSEQLDLRDVLATGWIRLTVGEEAAMLPLFDGSGSVPTRFGGIGLASVAHTPDRSDLASLAAADPGVTPIGTPVLRWCASMAGGSATPAVPCASAPTVRPDQVPAWAPMDRVPSAPSSPVLDLRWTAAGDGVTVAVPTAARDASDHTALTLRAAPGLTETTGVDLTITLVDGAGAQTSRSVATLGEALDPLPGSVDRPRRTLLRTVTLPLADVAAEIDLGDVREVRLTGTGAAGSALLADLAFTTPAVGTAPSPAALPSLTLDRLVVNEGGGTTTEHLGLRLSSPGASPVTAHVEVTGGVADAVVPVVVPAGTTCVAVPLAVPGDTAPSSQPRLRASVAATAIDGALPGAPVARLQVREDDGVTGSGSPDRSPGPSFDPCAPAAHERFTDVVAGMQHESAMTWLAATGVTTGWTVPGGAEYRPLAPVARDAMAAFLYRHAGSPAYTPPTVSPFRDVTPWTLYYKEITWLRAQGISTGWDVGGGAREFRPLQPVARDAMAAFLYRYAGSPAFTPPPTSAFVDVPSGAQHGLEMAWLASTGISTGWEVPTGREFRPLTPVARDAMAAFLHRYGLG